MTTVSVQEAQAKLSELIRKLKPGDELVITENNQPVAKLVPETPQPKPSSRPPPGLGKGCITIISDDEEHFESFFTLEQEIEDARENTGQNSYHGEF